jgi:UDP-N-acetylglucosamine acyltransferase
MNNIHHSVIIEGDVKLGNNNKILPNCVIYGPTEIGDDNIIGPNVVIGTPGQDTRNRYYDSSNCKIKIGNRNIIREFTGVQKPCYEDITFIGDDVYIMQSVHIPHDAHLYDKVVVTPMTVLAGLAKVLDGANIAIGCALNQRTTIGQYSIAAAGSVVMKNIKPFSRYIPGKLISVNKYAIEKYGFNDYYDEILAYVMDDIMPTSPIISNIVCTFNNWVDKYGLETYK